MNGDRCSPIKFAMVFEEMVDNLDATAEMKLKWGFVDEAFLCKDDIRGDEMVEILLPKRLNGSLRT